MRSPSAVVSTGDMFVSLRKAFCATKTNLKPLTAAHISPSEGRVEGSQVHLCSEHVQSKIHRRQKVTGTKLPMIKVCCKKRR